MSYYYSEAEEKKLVELIREINTNPNIQRHGLHTDPKEFRETCSTLKEESGDEVLNFYQGKYRSPTLIYLATGDFQTLGLAEIVLAGESAGHNFRTLTPEETSQWQEKIEQEPGYVENRRSLGNVICLPTPFGIFSDNGQETYLLSYLENVDALEEKAPAKTSFLILKIGKKTYLDLNTSYGGLWGFQEEDREPTKSFFK